MTRFLASGMLRLLSVALPGDLAEALVGDLAEEAPQHSMLWLARQAGAAIWFVHLARWRSAVSVAGIVAGLATAAAVIVAAGQLWALVLGAVPRRAGHSMGPGWQLSVLVVAIGAATVASVLVRPDASSPNARTTHGA